MRRARAPQDLAEDFALMNMVVSRLAGQVERLAVQLNAHQDSDLGLFREIGEALQAGLAHQKVIAERLDKIEARLAALEAPGDAK